MDEVTITYYGDRLDPARRVYLVDLGVCDHNEAKRRINRIRELFLSKVAEDEQE